MDNSSDAPKENSQAGRNRKRIFDHSEGNEEEGSSRRPNFVADCEVFRSRGGPNKKGFIENGLHFTEIIDQRLADNLDDTLTGLGVNTSTMPFNMNETMMALPTLTLLKQEQSSPVLKAAPTLPIFFDESSQSDTTDKFLKLFSLDSLSDGVPSPSLHQLLQQHVLYTDTHANNDSPTLLSQCESQTKEECILVTTDDTTTADSPVHSSFGEDNRFQFILSAPTSVACKINEESITYLNQGQSYEIKVKKLGDITRCQGKFYHSKIRVCFHERRLQYMEKEQIASWKLMRPGERILDIDVPLSYGITDVNQDPKYLNICEFDWEPSKEVGVYVKVNCISTEFTPKKHGGEKGVPFRLQVENYCRTDGGLDRVHVCACQIKVFKLKGADRKHKQDREKISKRSQPEQDKYQPQCECTILQEMSPETAYIPLSDEDEAQTSDTTSTPVSPSAELLTVAVTLPHPITSSLDPLIVDVKSLATAPARKIVTSNSLSNLNQEDPCRSFCDLTPDALYYNKPLHTSATAAQTQMWLNINRFSKHTSIFMNFTGNDILRLSRTEQKEICGLADGIRLFNALHARSIIPRLTLYVCPEYEQLYNAVYLENLTWTEFVHKVSSLVQISADSVMDVYLQGPSDINILVTDEVIMNFTPETMISVKVLPDSSGDRCHLLLRITSSKTTNSDP